MLTVNRVSDAFPSAPTTGFAVIFGVENNNSLTSSRLSPVIVTSKVVPTCPPIGIIVSRRGRGSVTCWANAGAARQMATEKRAERMAAFVGMASMIVQELLRIQ